MDLDDSVPRSHARGVRRGTTFRVRYELDDSGWHASIPEVRGCRTWGRSLSEARRNIREALSTCVDVFEDAEAVARVAELVDDVEIGAVAKRHLDAALVARAAAVEATALAKAETAKAARSLTAAGCSLRDAGELLGVSQEAVRLALRGD